MEGLCKKIDLKNCEAKKTCTVLGAGAFGTVYKVLGPKGKYYVMKEIPKMHTTARAFKREVEITKKLLIPPLPGKKKPRCRPRLLCYVDHCEDKDNYYLITEFAQGFVPLDEVLDKFNTEEKIKIMTNLAKAVEKMHLLGVVHRDLKPSNVMVNLETLQVLLIDFGLSCAREDKSCYKRQVGSPKYMAPEVLLNLVPQVHDCELQWDMLKRSDLWSLGIIFYMMLLNEEPYPKGIRTPDDLKNRFYRNYIAGTRPVIERVFSDELITYRPIITGLLQVLPGKRTPIEKIIRMLEL